MNPGLLSLMAEFADNSFPVNLSDKRHEGPSSGKENPAATRYWLMSKDAWHFGPVRVRNWLKAGTVATIHDCDRGSAVRNSPEMKRAASLGRGRAARKRDEW